MEAEQHSFPRSIVLHLLPGALILVFYVVVGVPVAERFGYPSLFGLLLAVACVLVPFEFGWLLYLGQKRNGRPSLEGIVLYRERMPLGRLAVLVLVLIGWAVFVGATLSWVDNLLLDELFSWVPERFLIEQGLGSYLTRYPEPVLIVTLLLGLILSGVVGPVAEELYFRGYVLPRISRLGRWAPVLNTALFAAYHLWTPWQVVTRIVFILPMVYAVWRKKNIYIALWTHCIGNTVGLLLVVAAVLAGVRP